MTQRLKKIISQISIFSALILFFGCGSGGDEKSFQPLPSDEAKFLNIIDSMETIWDDQPNDIKKENVRRLRAELFKKILPNRKVEGWVGCLKDFTVWEGYGIVEICAGHKCGFGCTKLKNSTTTLRVKQGTKLWDEMSVLEENTLVRFSGSFLRDAPEEHTYLKIMNPGMWEMKMPQFYFDLTSIEPYVENSEISE